MARRTLKTEIDVETGVVILEEHRLDGKLHRDPKEGPSWISRYWENGLTAEELYHWHGKRHRDDGPARIEWAPGSTFMAVEAYYCHGVEHRDPKEGPAYIQRWTGNKFPSAILYLVYGKAYRDPAEGPYLVQRDLDGTVTWVQYSEPGARRPFISRRRRTTTPGF